MDGTRTSASRSRFPRPWPTGAATPVRALLAVPPVVDAFGSLTKPDEPALESATMLLDECLAGLREDRPELIVDARVVPSHPIEALLNGAGSAAGSLVDVLHRGARGRGHGEVVGDLLGSVAVAVAVAAHAHCPAVVVRGDAPP